jgi:trans-aconitate 2-methyltransferase
MWNPDQYARYSDQRSRPFFELVDRIQINEPRDAPLTVVDLGCGPGNLTATLTERWPTAKVLGVDNDEAMLASARKIVRDDSALKFEHGDIATWRASGPVDVIVANAAFQWVLNHNELLPEFAAQVKPGGWFAFQVPGNLNDPHHQAIRSLRKQQPWASVAALAALPDRTHVSLTAVEYLDLLAPHGFTVDAWETSYVHLLQGSDPILEWVKGTGLRPVLAALETDEQRNDFCSELAPLLRASYPSKSYGTPFPFRRVFVVAQRNISNDR